MGKSPEELQFDAALRAWFLLATVYSVLYGAGFYALGRFRSVEEGGEGTSRASVSFLLGVLGLATATAAVLAVPATTVALTQLPASTAQWFGVEDIIFALWSHVIWLSDLNLTLLLPFAVFYQQAPGASVGRRTARALLEVLLLALVLSGIVLLVSLILVGTADWAASLGLLSSVVLPSLGLAVFAATTPAGWLRLMSMSLRLYVPWTASQRDRLRDRAHCLRLEASSLRQKQEMQMEHAAPALHVRRRMPALRLPDDELAAALARVEAKRGQIEALLAQSGWRNVWCALAVSGMLVLTATATVRLLLRPAYGLFVPTAAVAVDDWRPVFEQIEGSRWGCALDVCVTLTFFAAAVTGLYHNDDDEDETLRLELQRLSLARVRPRRGATPMLGLLLNTAVVGLLGFTLPVAVWVLGLASFDVMLVVNAHFVHVSLLRASPWVPVVYVFLFAASVGRTVLALVARPAMLRGAALHKYYAALSSPRPPRH